MRRAQEEFIRDHKDGHDLPTDRFELTDGHKIRCVLCGRTGYGAVTFNPDMTYPVRERGHRILLTFIANDLRVIEGPDTAPIPPARMPWWAQFGRWQLDCLADHPWPCSCGRQFRRYVDLWRHIGADRPTGWGRQGEHFPTLACDMEVA